MAATSNWSSLPLDLLGFIALKLEIIEDFTYFSAVCRSWNRASSSIKHQWSTKLPCLLLAENTQDNPNYARKMFNLSNNKCYKSNLPETFGARCWGSPYGWVAVAKSDHTIQLINPVTKANISFPSLETILNLRETNAEVFADYNNWCLTYFLEKLVVLKVSHAGRNEFVIMVIYQSHKYLAFARQGDQSWTDISFKEKSIRIYDVVAMDDHVYALYNNGALAYWNVAEFYGPESIKPMDYSRGNSKLFERPPYLFIRILYLIQSGTDLLMVIRTKQNVMNGLSEDDPQFNYDYETMYRTVDFDIYKRHQKEKTWEYVDDLDGATLLVGNNVSMSTKLANDKYLQRNCIYFTDDESTDWSMVKKGGGHDMGIYDIENDELLPQFYEGVDKRSTFGPPTFFIPQL